MPYKVAKQGSKWVVQKQDGSKSFGEHDSKTDAEKQMAALYANEPKAAEGDAAGKQRAPSGLRALHLVGATAPPRIAHLGEREYLVVPTVALIGDNVIHAVNAPQAEFVPASLVATDGWAKQPLVLGHPAKDGRQVSAHDPKVLAEYSFGFVDSPRLNGKRLGVDAWCDVAKLEAMGATKLLSDLRAGKPIEVSVGAFVTTAAKTGTHNGKAYGAEWTTIHADHLAMLPDSEGACSLDMGCGANRAAMRVMAGSDVLEVDVGKSIIDPETLKCLRDIPQSERDEMDASDFAGPDETYPIKTQADVDAAKHLVGKAGDPDAVKRKVIAIAKRKGLTVPDAWKDKPKTAARAMAKIKALVLKALDDGSDNLGDDADDETAESISYEAMRALFEQAKASLEAGATHVDALIDGDLADDVEDAHLEALVSMCVQLYGTTNGLVKQAQSCLQPDGTPSMMTYMEARAAAGARHNKSDQQIIQDTHDKMVQLGADCPGVKAAASGACGCGGDMTKSEQVQKLVAAAKKDEFSKEQIEGLEMLPEANLAHLVTLAAKSPADAIVQAKYNADAAVAAHGHAMNMQDEADKAKKKAKEDKAKTAAGAGGSGKDADSEDEEDETPPEKDTEKKMKTAQAAGFKTIAEHEEAKFLEAHPHIKKVVDRQLEADASRKASLIKALAAHGALSEEKLKAKTLDQLEELAAFARLDEEPVLDYSGRGLPPMRAAEGTDDVFRNPPNSYDEAIKARQQKAATH